MISISEPAHEQILKEIPNLPVYEENETVEKGNVPHIRLGLQPYTEEYGGARYLFFSDIPQDGDTSLNFDDYVILIHGEHADDLNGVHIDYRVEGLQKRFDFVNPNLKNIGVICGCGTDTAFDNSKHRNIPTPPPLNLVEDINNNEDLVSKSEGS